MRNPVISIQLNSSYRGIARAGACTVLVALLFGTLLFGALLFGALLLSALLPLAGCGGSQTFPPTQNGYARNAGGRCIALVWGVQFKIEGAGTDEPSVETTGTLIDADDDSSPVDAQVELVAGTAIVTMQTNRRFGFELQVNGVSYGKLNPGNKVEVDINGRVKVNGQLRQPDKS